MAILNFLDRSIMGSGKPKELIQYKGYSDILKFF